MSLVPFAELSMIIPPDHQLPWWRRLSAIYSRPVVNRYGLAEIALHLLLGPQVVNLAERLEEL